jgi:glycosyltransferase involved in cell wall biosynthesis
MTFENPREPLVSILMVARNARGTVEFALASLLLQSYSNWECLIADDASTDGTAELLCELQDPRFKVQRSTEHLGRGGARNLALQKASGVYLASLDADDFLFRDAIASQVEVLQADSGLDACTGSLFLFSPEGLPLGRRRSQIRPGRYKIESPLTTRIPLGSTMIRRSLVGNELFQETLKRSEDRDFYDRVLDGSTVEVLGRLTYAYRWNLRFENVMAGLRNRSQLASRRFRRSPFRAAFQIVVAQVKLACYPVVRNLGLWNSMALWRVKPAKRHEAAFFEDALQTLHTLKVSGSC